MRLAIAAGLSLMALSGCSGPDWFKHFDVTRANLVDKGMTKAQVVEVVGPPQTVVRVPRDRLHATEVWTWTNNTRGWLLPNTEVLAVGFDASGHVVDRVHTKTKN